MPDLRTILVEVRGRLPEGMQTLLGPLFQDELLETFVDRLLQLHESDNVAPQAPHFAEENTPPAKECFTHFAAAIATWQSNQEAEASEQFVAAFQKTDMPKLLAILGQRTTPGSVVDHRAFPPQRQLILGSANKPLSDDATISCAARALAKHADRSDETFWGNVSGAADHQNAVAQEFVDRILNGATWWNVFEHFQHGPIYEVRLPSGHGARWTHDGQTFIGFVDPFDQTERRDVQQEATITEDTKEFPPLPETVTREVIEQRYAEGQRNFESLDLSGIDLQNLDLRGINLRGSSLVKAKLFGTSLEEANLTDCDLQGTYLVKTHLSGVRARRVNMRGCRMDGIAWRDMDLQGANLGQTNLHEAELTDCRMKGVNLREADLTNVKFVNNRMYGVGTEGANFHGASFQHCKFNNGRLGNTDFSEASFERCRFESADLTGATCVSTQFQSCEFIDADFGNANLSEAKLRSARLDRSNLNGARLDGADLEDADLSRANLSRAKLEKAKLCRANLTQADLTRADLRSANLAGATLDRADLSSADVVDTVVDEYTSFEAAKTTGVDFGTNWTLRQQVLDSAHNLTIQQFCRKKPVLGFFWWALLGCGKRNSLLLVWGIVIVFVFAGLMAAQPSSFDFGQTDPTQVSFLDHLRNSMAVFVTLDLAVDKGVDDYGKGVMLVQMLLSYLMLGFMASLFSSIFPNPPE